MSITGPVVLPPDVSILPVRSLPPWIRRGLRAGPGAFAVTRPRGRATSKVVDAAGAELLAEFRTPQRVVEAVAAYSRRRNLDPRRVLAEAFPLLRDCVNARFLVEAGSPEAGQIQPSLARGDRLDQWIVLRAVQVLDDSEVYQARSADGGFAALKVLRPGAPRALRRLVAREASALEQLGGAGAPRLLGRGTHRGEPLLALSWCAGVSPLVLAAELRDQPGGDAALLRLAVAVADAYAALHAAGVVHGDVHPRNLLVNDTTVTVLDFALARFTDRPDRSRSIPRGSIPALRDPGYAAALLAGRTPPRAGAAAEQYALAALLYLVIAGCDYLDLPLVERDALDRIVRAPPRPFAAAGRAPWPEVEAVLSRALAKAPGDRFASVAEFAASLRAAATPPAPGTGTGASRTAPVAELTDQVLRDLRLDEPAYSRNELPAPAASVAFGAAGIAWALYRIACLRDDAALLSAADAWLTRAEHLQESPVAFASDETGLGPADVGYVSPYHCVSGLHCVRALVSLALGNGAAASAAVERFVAASAPREDCADLFTGRAGTLIGAALLLEALPARDTAAAASLEALGGVTLRRLWDEADGRPPIPQCSDVPALGIAHGWGGLAFATLRWHRVTGAAPPPGLSARLDELAALAEPAGRGLRWRVRVDETDSVPGAGYQSTWCNGAAGLVHLWTLAHRVTGAGAYLRLAEGAAWNAWESTGAAAHICCGPAGRAYALLALYQATGATAWLGRARQLADRAAIAWSRETIRPYPLSLYKGATGIAVLGADLERPESAGMPFFAEEGWPRPGRTRHE